MNGGNPASETEIKKELIDTAKEALSKHTQESELLANAIAEAFVSIILPKNQGGSSQKRVDIFPQKSQRPANFWNVVLNWRKLMEAIPEIILLGKDIVDKPVWLWPFAGLIIYQKTSSLMEIEFTIADSVTLLALWEAQNEYHVVDEDDGYHATNRRRSDFGMDAISRCQYETSIDHLCQAGCIELESGTISFREKVVVEWETTG